MGESQRSAEWSLLIVQRSQTNFMPHRPIRMLTNGNHESRRGIMPEERLHHLRLSQASVPERHLNHIRVGI